MNFKKFLIHEQEENLDGNLKGKIDVSVLWGNMQPIHNGHLSVVQYLVSKYPNKKVFIAVVNDGKETFDFDLQRELILNSLGELKSNVVVYDKPLSNGHVATVISASRKAGYEPKVITTGSDTASAHEEELNKLKKTYSSIPDIKLVTLPRASNAIHGTEIRNAIKRNDFETFKASTNKGIWDYFERLREEI